jgi:hypothetical protein
LTLQVYAYEKVKIDARVVRDKQVIARRLTSALAVGEQRVRIVVPRSVAAGDAMLKVSFSDGAGNRSVVKRALHVPRKHAGEAVA